MLHGIFLHRQAIFPVRHQRNTKIMSTFALVMTFHASCRSSVTGKVSDSLTSNRELASLLTQCSNRESFYTLLPDTRQEFFICMNKKYVFQSCIMELIQYLCNQRQSPLVGKDQGPPSMLRAYFFLLSRMLLAKKWSFCRLRGVFQGVFVD